MQDNTLINQIDNETLYSEFFTPLFRYLFFRVKDYDIANDLTQISFLKFLNKRFNTIDKDYATKLLFVIARNTLIDYWRTEKKRDHMDIEEFKDIESIDSTPEENAIQREDEKFVKETLENLNEIEREVVSMRISGDIPYEVVASTLDISVINARKIYSRALQKVGFLLKNSNRF